MKSIAGIFAIILLAWYGLTFAQKVEEPEDCILNTLRNSGAAANNAAMVRYNCVRRYFRQVEPMAKAIDASSFPQATATWTPQIQAFPEPIPSYLKVTLKNDTVWRVISAGATIVDKETNRSESYHLLADSPIDPLSVGSLSAKILWDGKSGNDPAKFWSSHAWALTVVYGVPK